MGWIVFLILVTSCSCFNFRDETEPGCWWDYGEGEREKKCDYISYLLNNFEPEILSEILKNKSSKDKERDETMDSSFGPLVRALADAKPNLLAVTLNENDGKLLLATAIALQTKRNGMPPAWIFRYSGEECRCSDFTVRGKNGLYEGNCLSKFKSYYWCYVEGNGRNCRDRTFSKTLGRFWSFSACYLE